MTKNKIIMQTQFTWLGRLASLVRGHWLHAHISSTVSADDNKSNHKLHHTHLPQQHDTNNKHINTLTVIM